MSFQIARETKSAQRAFEQRHAYRLSFCSFKVREHGGASYEVPICYVIKQDGTTYTVIFRKAGVPACSCPDSQKHRGTAHRCKHVVMAEAARPRSQSSAKREQIQRARQLWD